MVSAAPTRRPTQKRRPSGRSAKIDPVSSTPDPDQFAKAATAARRGWTMVASTGGLLTIAEIARRWDVEEPTARKATRREDFPAPAVTIGRSDLWLAPEVDQWRATPRKVGRPRKTD